MDQKDKATDKAKPETTTPTTTPAPASAPKQARWPGQGSAGGIKNAKAGHDRKTIGRGAARGR